MNGDETLSIDVLLKYLLITHNQVSKMLADYNDTENELEERTNEQKIYINSKKTNEPKDQKLNQSALQVI